MTIKKQYWIDFSLFSPNIKAELITIPDLEIPGRIAIDWNTPKSKADFKLKLNEKEFFNKLISIIRAPLANNEYWTNSKLKNCSKSNIRPKMIAGIVDITNNFKVSGLKKSFSFFEEKKEAL